MEAQSSGVNKSRKPSIVAAIGVAVILFLTVVALIGYAITQKNQIEKLKADLAQETQTSARLQADLDQTTQKASTLKSELGTTTQKLQTELSRKPPLPVGVRYRQAMLGHGLVAAFRNTSTQQLLFVVEVKNPTINGSKTFQLNIAPGMVQEVGYAEGWAFSSGDIISVANAVYEPLKATVP